MALEVTREVRLVAEADVRGDLSDRFPIEEALSRRLDPPAQDVFVRCDSECIAEAANEMCGARSDELAGRSERHRLEGMLFE